MVGKILVQRGKGSFSFFFAFREAGEQPYSGEERRGKDLVGLNCFFFNFLRAHVRVASRREGQS